MKENLVLQQERQAMAPVARARGAHMAVLVGPDQGEVRFITRRFRLDPGGRIPCHRHPDIEHEQVVLSGEMHLGLDDETHVVRAGDALLIPAGVAHWYENRGDTAAEFLCVVPLTPTYETEWLEPPL